MNTPDKSKETMNSYDSKADTLEHIRKVQAYLNDCAIELIGRGTDHDASKLFDPEKSEFDRLTPRLKSLTYGSPEYKESLAELKTALDHHYANNSHHPEHYSEGISGMNLFDVLEMLMDWKAASERHEDGDILKSIEINTERFNISPQLKQILLNTVNYVFLNG